MNKKACFLLAGALMLPVVPAHAQTTDTFDLIAEMFITTEELLECDSPNIVIDYPNCDSKLNYYDVMNGYSHNDNLVGDITIETENGQVCYYDKYMADFTDSDILWQAYLSACAIKWNELPTANWTFNGAAIGDANAEEAIMHYIIADDMIYNTPVKLSISRKRKYIYHQSNPFMAEYRLEKKVKGHWRVQYDKMVGDDLTGNKERLKRGKYRLTVVRFDGIVIYRNIFKI